MKSMEVNSLEEENYLNELVEKVLDMKIGLYNQLFLLSAIENQAMSALDLEGLMRGFISQPRSKDEGHS